MKEKKRERKRDREGREEERENIENILGPVFLDFEFDYKLVLFGVI